MLAVISKNGVRESHGVHEEGQSSRGFPENEEHAIITIIYWKLSNLQHAGVRN